MIIANFTVTISKLSGRRLTLTGRPARKRRWRSGVVAPSVGSCEILRARVRPQGALVLYGYCSKRHVVGCGRMFRGVRSPGSSGRAVCGGLPPRSRKRRCDLRWHHGWAGRLPPPASVSPDTLILSQWKYLCVSETFWSCGPQIETRSWRSSSAGGEGEAVMVKDLGEEGSTGVGPANGVWLGVVPGPFLYRVEKKAGRLHIPPTTPAGDSPIK